MKIIETEDVPKFKPVTVVFESQAEIDIITALLAATPTDAPQKVGIDIDIYQFYLQMLELATKVNFNYSDKIKIKATNK